MRLGFNIPNLGPVASAENVAKVAQRAEALGYDTVWVTERLLWPINPQTPYAGSSDGSLPEAYKIQLDPLGALTYAAAHTRRIGLGTSVLDMPYYNPVMLARNLTTLDVFSGGRLRVGLGQGWSQDEFDATGASMKTRAGRADEFLQVLHAIWKTDPAEFNGKHFRLPKSIIQPKPVQKPHPPIYLAAFSSPALKRIATLGDGWNPVAIPADGMKQMWEGVKAMAKEAGRDPNELEMVVRANLGITSEPITLNRFIFTGSLDQIRGDIQACREIGASEVHFDTQFSPEGGSVDGYLNVAEKMRELTG
ncbi:MAG: LLM class F420-dependent oxidoreductase [Chloroflexi bacterium]|jgi:probable F420-dependent oxidoreductase|nr:MAG: LLM class F420-dependent oxidoreductase [Chloroflexota bacterium]